MLGDTWGATEAETRAGYPCDAYVADPSLAVWRSVTVDAPIADVWPWLVQTRLAPYSYDWLDNRGRRSPQERHDLPDPHPGDPFMASGGRPVGVVLEVGPQVHLTGRIMGVTISYCLHPVDLTTTRLTMKATGRLRRGLNTVVSVGDLLMARRQLLNLKRLAESTRGV
ncbi:MAG: hypothetical protein ACXVW4_01325 [Nocardioides sp.]